MSRINELIGHAIRTAAEPEWTIDHFDLEDGDYVILTKHIGQRPYRITVSHDIELVGEERGYPPHTIRVITSFIYDILLREITGPEIGQRMYSLPCKVSAPTFVPQCTTGCRRRVIQRLANTREIGRYRNSQSKEEEQ